jgi:type II secretory pathway component PulJ
MPNAECRIAAARCRPSSVFRPPSSATRAGFTLAEVLVALACALVITVAAASALIAVLRSERAQWTERRASQQAESWLAAHYAGRAASEPAMPLRRVVPEDEKLAWVWLTPEPAAGRPVRPTVWTRTRAGEPAQ